ncbi:MAG: AIR synthase-related protein [Nitrososphaerales archaeon]|jgi:hydrogenase maturation factor
MGKADPEFMKEVVYASLGKKSRRLVIRPRKGSDNAVIAIGGGRIMILTVDPVSIIPSLGMELSGWLSVHLIASDYTTSGLRPEYATFSFNFPSGLSDADREEYVRSTGEECRKLGITIAAGHTGSYPGAGFTVVGAGSMFGFGRLGGFVDPSMARPGDAILMTKQAGIEATASLALSFPRHVEAKVGRLRASRAKKLIRSCSTVTDAFTAARIGLGRGGITSMHDATEGGVLGGLEEMAYASESAFHVDEGRIYVSEEVGAVCRAFGLDPLGTLSEGTLLMTCNPNRLDDVKDEFAGSGIPIREIGSVRVGAGLWTTKGDGRPKRIKPRVDGYWAAYGDAIGAGLR